jgi:hypothetical protein
MDRRRAGSQRCCSDISSDDVRDTLLPVDCPAAAAVT